MDSINEIVLNARERLGFSGIRNIKDLGVMRQETLEKKLRSRGERLTTKSIVSIYMAWMAENIAELPSWDDRITRKMCDYLMLTDCRVIDAIRIWNEAVLETRIENAMRLPERERLNRREHLVERAIIYALSPASNVRNIVKDAGKATSMIPQLNPEGSAVISHRLPPNRQETNLETKPQILMDLEDKHSDGPMPAMYSGSMMPPHGYACPHCNETGHGMVDCPFLSRATIEQTPPPGYTCNKCGSIRHFLYDCPRNDTEILRMPGGQDPITENRFDQRFRAEITKNERRLALPRQNSPELQYDEPGPTSRKTSDDRPVLWKGSTPSNGRLTPWSEDGVGQSQAANTTGRQETRGDRISLLEANSFLAEVLQEFEEMNLRIPDTKGSSSIGMGHGHAFDGSPPRKIQKREPAVNETCAPDDIHSCWEDSEEERVFNDDSCISLLSPEPKPPIEFHHTTKPLYRHPPYEQGVLALFNHRDNVWIQRTTRPAALDMWPTTEHSVDEQEQIMEVSL